MDELENGLVQALKAKGKRPAVAPDGRVCWRAGKTELIYMIARPDPMDPDRWIPDFPAVSADAEAMVALTEAFAATFDEFYFKEPRKEN